MVPRESDITPNQQFTPGKRLVLHAVPHTWYIDKFGFVESWRKPNTTSTGWVARSYTQTRRTGLRRSIAFDDGTRENNAQEVEHLGIQRSRAGGNELEFPAKQLSNLGYHTLGQKVEDREVSYLLKHQAIPKWMGINASFFESFELSLNCSSKEGPLETRGVRSGHDSLVDSVQQSGDRREEVRL